MSTVTTGGTYSLVVSVDEPTVAEVGALGEVAFDAGWYAYAGSARGPGGFARLDRHVEVARGERDVCHWHVDALLGLEESTVDRDVRTPGADRECAVAAATAGDPVYGFGSTDCDCRSHLHHAPRRDELLASLQRAHETAASGRRVTL